MDGFAGAIGISDSKGKSTPVYTVIEPDGRADLGYVAYLLREMSRSGKIESLARSIRERTTDFRWNMWSVINFPFPPIEEQKIIARYLDKKTSQIDSLINKIEKKIELLKEQRTSMINLYVTKGLNSNVEMKDSGVEWIGEIPKHWTITRLKMVTVIVNGFAFNSDDFDIDNEIPVVRIGDVKSPFDLESCMKVKKELFDRLSRFQILKNDILVGMTGGTIGKSSSFDTDKPALLNQRVCIFRPLKSISQDFLSLVISSDLFKRQVDINCDGGGQPNIGKDQLLNFSIYIPPYDEQIQIVNFVFSRLNNQEPLQKSEEKRLYLLGEYRKSLISSVVTGKLRVTEEMI
jgi:type I restriction enzyme S subunit